MSESNGGMKLLLSYNINLENAQTYYEFVLGRYIPAMQALGLEVSEAWHTAYGDYPDRLIGFVTQDRETMMSLLKDEEWEELNEQLLEHVGNFSYKVIPHNFGFQF